MFAEFKAKCLFRHLFKRPDINKAYKMVGPEDSWYDTITTVHNSLAEIRKIPHENWQVVSHDGYTQKALFYPCEGSRKTMIWVHGYTSHAERESAFPALFYRSMGYNVLIPYLRAHGPSQGRYICFGEFEARDIQKWADKVNFLHPDGNIVIHGLSMGGGIVLDLACREIRNVKALISDAPSISFEGILHQYPVSVFKKDGENVANALKVYYKQIWGVNPRDYDRTLNIKDGRYPLLLSAGSNENLDGELQKIKERNPAQTEIIILPGCNHGNGMYKQTEMYQGAIRDFLEHYVER